MALQLRRGTNKERLQITPAEGELIFVTDWELVQITGTSIDGTTDTITFSAAHGLSVGDQILFQSSTQLGLTNGTSYFVISAGLTTTACKVSTSSGGSAVDLTTGSALTLTFAKTPTTAAGVPVGSNVAALWIGDGTTVGGIPGNTQGLDDLSDVIITTPAQGDLLFYNGTDWVNENVIQTGDANNRPVFQFNNTSAGVNAAIVLRKNYGTGTFTAGDGTGIRFEVDSNSQATTEYATLNVAYDAAAPEFSLNTSINDSTYQTAMTSSTVVTDIRGDLRVRGNDIKNSTDDILITMAAGAAAQVTFAGDIQVSGNDIKSSGGTTAITMNGANVTIAGDLTVNGTTTTINSTTLTVDDKNIELASTASPSDTLADGGGITLRGDSNKTILWENASDWWRFNQHLATDVNLYLNADQTAANAVVYFGTSSSLTDKELRWDTSLAAFRFSDDLRVAGNIGAEGSIAVNRDASDDNAVINFYKPTSGIETLQWDKTDNRFEFSDNVYASGTLAVDGDSITINADGTAVDSYLYLKSNTHYIKWDEVGVHIDASHTFKTYGDLQANGDLQLNEDQTNADVTVYFGTTGSKTDKQLRWDVGDVAFRLTDAIRVEGNIGAEGNININRDASDDNAVINFYKPTTGIETLQWDKTDTRFEFSNKLFVNGDGIINGNLYVENSGDVYIDGDSIVLNNGNAAATSTITFYTNGTTDPTLKWNNSTTQFEMNRALVADTSIGTNGLNIYFNQDDSTPGASDHANLVVKRGAGADVVFRWNETSDRWESTTDGSTYIELPDQGLDQADTPTFAGSYMGNIRIAVTNDNEIDTGSGNLTIDSAGGTTTIDDALVVSGDFTHNGATATFNNNVVLGSSSADTITMNGTIDFNEGITVGNITIGITTDNTITTTTGNLVLSSAAGITIDTAVGSIVTINPNLDVNGTVTTTGLLVDTGGAITMGNNLHKFGMIQQTITTSTATTDLVGASWGTNAFRSVEFMLQATKGTEYQVVKGMAIHDGTNTWINTYSDIKTGSSDLFTVNATIAGSDFKLQVVSASATSTTYKGSWTAIAV